MQKMRREAIRYAGEAGVTDLVIDERSKHLQLKGTLRTGRPFFFTVSLGSNAAARNLMRQYIIQAVRRQERASA
jgi:hypothetical protein